MKTLFVSSVLNDITFKKISNDILKQYPERKDLSRIEDILNKNSDKHIMLAQTMANRITDINKCARRFAACNYYMNLNNNDAKVIGDVFLERYLDLIIN